MSDQYISLVVRHCIFRASLSRGIGEQCPYMVRHPALAIPTQILSEAGDGKPNSNWLEPNKEARYILDPESNSSLCLKGCNALVSLGPRHVLCAWSVARALTQDTWTDMGEDSVPKWNWPIAGRKGKASRGYKNVVSNDLKWKASTALVFSCSPPVAFSNSSGNMVPSTFAEIQRVDDVLIFKARSRM